MRIERALNNFGRYLVYYCSPSVDRNHLTRELGLNFLLVVYLQPLLIKKEFRAGSHTWQNKEMFKLINSRLDGPMD